MSSGPYRGKGVGRQKPGEEIRAKFLNDIARASETTIAAGPGLSEIFQDGRQYLRALNPDGKLARTPSGGIPAASYSGGTLTPGKADCTLFDPGDEVWILGSAVETVYNTQAVAVAGNTNIQCKRMDGRLVVDVEPC